MLNKYLIAGTVAAFAIGLGLTANISNAEAARTFISGAGSSFPTTSIKRRHCHKRKNKYGYYVCYWHSH
jgi:hypothetical protein